MSNLPNLIIDEKEIFSTSKQITRTKKEVDKYIKEIVDVINDSMEKSIKDKEICEQLKDILLTVKSVKTQFDNCCNELNCNMVNFANQVNDIDNEVDFLIEPLFVQIPSLINNLFKFF